MKDKNAEQLFRELGFWKYESKQLNSISYEHDFLKVVFMLKSHTYDAQILRGDLNFPKYTPMEISVDLHNAISKQIEELGWKNE